MALPDYELVEIPEERQKGQLPGYIRIGPRLYKVTRGRVDDWGECRYDRREININENLKAEPPYTLMHEIAHCSLRFTPYAKKANEDEDLMDYVAELFIQLIRDNPELVRYLQETAE